MKKKFLVSDFGLFVSDIITRDWPIWLFWGRCRYIGCAWTDSRYW